ncbi:hypothetical protein ACNSPB_26730 [Yersinia enterocolitica]|uniref:hypothetical protein n=1 Tax=Yersinia mollaretii TaxID=33060 RepID=UPI0011A11E86|nr:hypothetical protein [Yersinia mollaretii]EKN5020703.1 hypothetical protein [Yersinia enterocolitica]EKN5068340.1 hypothetical protein [Yersinia enterocolitica]EKN5130700.1 hypothetical protein [Yersinia enterocolitica]HDL6990073.1 hypothetical protein [Yersinia enterocolitica]HDL6999461.1 hypothetical protein [Yersinia enterocolitica]
MRKIKWIKIGSDFSMTQMAEKLLLDSFTEEKAKGFILNKVRNGFLQGRFIEKVIFEDRISSLFGEDTIIERVEYKITDFSFDEDSYPIAVITNPPRTLKPFANALVKNLGLGVSLEEVIVNPFIWISEISKKYPIAVNQIDISQMQVSEYALAKMQISSTKDLLDYYEKELAKRQVRVDRVNLSISTPEFSGKFKVFRNGMVNIEVKNEKEFSFVLFNALKLALKRVV